jgi:hypothetical protein
VEFDAPSEDMVLDAENAIAAESFELIRLPQFPVEEPKVSGKRIKIDVEHEE